MDRPVKRRVPAKTRIVAARLTPPISTIETMQVRDAFFSPARPDHWDKITVTAVDAMLSTIITRFMIWFALTIAATEGCDNPAYHHLINVSDQKLQ